MTREEALKEAQRRWGNHFGIFMCNLKDGRFYVSNEWDNARTQRGIGDSWEAAFADADRREKGNQP